MIFDRKGASVRRLDIAAVLQTLLVEVNPDSGWHRGDWATLHGGGDGRNCLSMKIRRICDGDQFGVWRYGDTHACRW